MQGKPGKDIDLTFICTKKEIQEIASWARAQGMKHTCQTPNREKHCSCEDKGGPGWSYADCVCACKPGYDYIRFGDPEKRDVEGVIMHSDYLGKEDDRSYKEGHWGGGEFTCNALLF